MFSNFYAVVNLSDPQLFTEHSRTHNTHSNHKWLKQQAPPREGACTSRIASKDIARWARLFRIQSSLQASLPHAEFRQKSTTSLAATCLCRSVIRRPRIFGSEVSKMENRSPTAAAFSFLTWGRPSFPTLVFRGLRFFWILMRSRHRSWFELLPTQNDSCPRDPPLRVGLDLLPRGRDWHSQL